jgi:hypothetical protein
VCTVDILGWDKFLSEDRKDFVKKYLQFNNIIFFERFVLQILGEYEVNIRLGDRC